MGIYDRDYFQKGRRGSNPIVVVFGSAVGTLITVNIAVWIVQVATTRDSWEPVTTFLAAIPGKVFAFEVWRLVTANFVHSTGGVWHLAFNMLFLFYVGREIEHIYGKRDFFVFYFTAGIIAVAAEVVALHFSGRDSVQVMGASGAVMAVAVLCALFYPMRQIYFMGFIPIPLWLLCVLYVGGDFLAVLRGADTGVANLAHLTGALVGVLYYFLDPRIDRLRRFLPHWRVPARPRAARRPKERIVELASARSSRESASRAPDPISERIDELLEKISVGGGSIESLTEEEREFLRENSGRYRSGRMVKEEEP